MAKKTLIILGSILAFAALGYFALAQVSAYDNSIVLADYTVKEDHFQALFPRQPNYAATDIPLSPTETVRYNSYVALGGDQTLYLLTSAIYPVAPDPKNARQHLQIFLQQFMRNSPENLVIRLQEITFQNNPALDFTLVNKGFWTYGRAILAEDTVFILLCSNGSNALARKNFHIFASSLKIKIP
jgi:hypothetical protein